LQSISISEHETVPQTPSTSSRETKRPAVESREAKKRPRVTNVQRAEKAAKSMVKEMLAAQAKAREMREKVDMEIA